MSSQSSARAHRSRLVTADDFDVVYGRDIYCYLQRAGAADRAKRRIRRRDRRRADRAMRRDPESA